MKEEYTGHCPQQETGLLHFLVPDGRRLQVLVLDSSHLLPQLRQLLPQAELHAVTADEEEPSFPEYAGLNIDWQVLDFRHQLLPFPKEFFDLAIGDRFLEAAAETSDLTGGLGRYLKDTGFLLASFKNIRYHRIIREIMTGHFTDFIAEKPLAKPEVVRMLGTAFYKDIEFAPGRRDCELRWSKEIESLGFENFQNDLATEIWLVKAGRAEPEIAALKELYTPAVRRQLARLLRRIEYDVQRPEALVELKQLVKAEGIFGDYLTDFIFSTSCRPEELLQMLKDNNILV